MRRRLSQPLRLLLTALLALAAASLLSHAFHEPFACWLVDILLFMTLARSFWLRQCAARKYEANGQRETGDRVSSSRT